MSATASTSSRRSRLSKILHTSPKSHFQALLNGKKNKPQRLLIPDNGSQTLYLRVNRRFLLRFPAATDDEPNPQPLPPLSGATGNLNVIIANLSDLRPFAGDTVDWLIKLAKLIFQPFGTSSLYTFTTESLEWWLDREMEPLTWRNVVHGEKLRATIYEFRPDNDALVMLTQKSQRRLRSVTTNTSSNPAATFRDALLRRDRGCVISRQNREEAMIASHLIPRRLGDDGVQAVIQRFTGSSTSLDRFDPTIGVVLFTGLDICVDAYDMGFWNNGPDKYVVHNFLDWPLGVYGQQPNLNEENVHGRQITLSSHDSSVSLPPVGVFDWHYTQCVLKKFSTPAYQEINNISYFFLPFRTRDDDDESDIEFDDERNIADPPCSSYFWDLAQWRMLERLEAEERDRAIVTWSSGIPTS